MSCPNSCEIIDYRCEEIEQREFVKKIYQCHGLKEVKNFLQYNKYKKLKAKEFYSFLQSNFAMSQKVFHYVNFALMLMIVILLTIALSFNKFTPINNALKFMGNISLESYIINGMLIEIFKSYNIISENVEGVNSNKDAIMYLFICVFGVILAYLYHNLILFLYNRFVKTVSHR